MSTFPRNRLPGCAVSTRGQETFPTVPAGVTGSGEVLDALPGGTQ